MSSFKAKVSETLYWRLGRHLETLNVWRFLAKPVPLKMRQQIVSDALVEYSRQNPDAVVPAITAMDILSSSQWIKKRKGL